MPNEIEAQRRRNQQMNALLRDDRRAVKGLPPEAEPATSHPPRPQSIDAGTGTGGSPTPEEPDWNDLIRRQIERPE